MVRGKGFPPKYTSKNMINPIATIWAGLMMLEQLGEKEAGDSVAAAVKKVLEDSKFLTKDLGGKSSTSEVGDAIVDVLQT